MGGGGVDRGAQNISKHTYFRKIPKNMRSFEESSGGFSGATAIGVMDEESVSVDEAAFVAGEFSTDPDDVDAMASMRGVVQGEARDGDIDEELCRGSCHSQDEVSKCLSRVATGSRT